LSSVLVSVLPFLAIIVLLVVVHELGHFITAKLAGVRVLEFGIGFPPRAFAVRRGETEYSINWLPLGGFVKLLGEEDPSDPRSLAAQAAWKRLIVMGAGSFMNLVFAVVLFSVALMIPREVPVGRAQIVQVVPDAPAQVAGLKPGDIILEIDGREIDSVAEASYNIQLNLGEETEIVVRRPNTETGVAEVVSVHLTPRWAPGPYDYVVQEGDTVSSVAEATGFGRDSVRQSAAIETAIPANTVLTIDFRGDTLTYETQEDMTVASVSALLRISEEAVRVAAGLPDQESLVAGETLQFAQGATGIQIGSQYPFTESRSYGPLEALRRGVRQTTDSLKLARNQIYSWIKGASAPQASGPIGIAQVTGEVVQEAGWKSLVDLAAVLSVNLAILNILPLPMLDGGRMAFVLIEIARRGKRVAPAKEALVHFIGMAALLILVLVLSYFDIARIIEGKSLFR
jgi:regulator of sigma E protease